MDNTINARARLVLSISYTSIPYTGRRLIQGLIIQIVDYIFALGLTYYTLYIGSLKKTHKCNIVHYIGSSSRTQRCSIVLDVHYELLYKHDYPDVPLRGNITFVNKKHL